MKKIVVLVVVIAVIAAGVAAWALTRSTPERRLCSRLGDLCAAEGSYDDLDACVKEVEKLNEALGKKRIDETAACVDEASSCSMAAGCLAGTGMDVLKDVAKDFLEGVLKSGKKR